MRKKVLQSLIIGVLPFLAGCIDTNDQFTINPDGSGKVVHEAKLRSFYLSTQSKDSNGNVIHSSQLVSVTDKQPSADDLKGAVKNLLQNSKGVDAWKDVSYKILDDGRIYFKGTAYFPDISKLKIDNQGVSTTIGDIVWQAGPDRITLELNSQNKTQASAAPPAPKLQTDDDIKKAVTRQVQQYRQMRPMLAGFLTDLKIGKSFILPGHIETMTNFQKKEDGSVSVQWDGSKILANMDQMANDTDYIAGLIKEGKNFANQNDMDANKSNKMLFGQDGPVQVALDGPFSPLFDYGEELKEAKIEYTKIISGLTVNNAVSSAVNSSAAPGINPVPAPALTNKSGSPQAALKFQADESDDSCGTLQNARSKESRIPVPLTILNHSNEPLNLWWTSSVGEQKMYAHIPAGGTYKQKSFATHVWEIENQKSNNCVGELQLGPSGESIEVF